MLNEFNEGGSHEENKLGGIPQGVGNNGQLNTVEEGETKKDNFIYSDRIKLTPELVSQFNLPKVLANKTAAEATKIINTKFEGRNSTIDNSTKKAMLDRIAEAQETVKQVEAQKQAEIAEALNINSTMDPEDQMEGQIPQGMEEFLPQEQMFNGGYLDLGINALDLGTTAFGKTGIDTSGATNVNPGSISVGGSALSGLTKGAQAGAMFGPWGAGIGAAVGGVAGLIGGSRAKKDALKANQNFEIGESNKKISNFAFGGDLTKLPLSENPKILKKLNNKEVIQDINTSVNPNLQDTISTSRLKGKIVSIDEGMDGKYIYYKPKSTPGFNPETDRDYVLNKNWETVRSTDEYLNYLRNRTNAFLKGGNMYNNGGGLTDPTKPWMLPKSTIADDPNLSGSGPFGFRKTFDGVPYSKELPLDQQIDIKSTYNPKTLYKQSFNQMRKPQISNDLGYTSKLNYNDPDTVNLSPEQLQENNSYSNPENAPSRMFGPQPNGHYEGEMYDGSKLGKALNKTGQYLKDNYGNILRYSPVAMNALQLHKLNKSGYDTVNPMINNTRYNPQYMDEKALVNQINAESNYAGNSLANASNGSMGALRSNILASQLAKTKGLSDAYSRVAEVNRNEEKTGQQFNLGVDEANIARRIAAEDKTAMNKGNWETNKSRLLGQIGTDLGNIGKEEVYKKLAKESFGYTWDGKYYIGPKGDKLTTQQMESKIDNETNKNTTNQNRFGGYIMSKKFKK